jgi:PAS domain S-box-containing protein
MPIIKETSAGFTAKHGAAIRRKAEDRLRKQQRRQSKPAIPKSTADSLRLVHELQVHQIELEMQNAELQDARERTDVLLEKYTDLYDFAPVGYFTLDNQGRIQEVNLTGASLLGTERSRLINQPLSRSLKPASQTDFLGFLGRIFAGSRKEACEVAVVKGNDSFFWASFHGTLPFSSGGPQKTCRVVVSDITALKQAEEAQHRLEALAASILTLEQEISHRKETEGSLKQTSRQHIQLLAQSRQMQDRLRNLSHHIMSTQDDDHRQISTELYAVISQALAGINIRLETITKESAVGAIDLDSKVTGMKQMVVDSMDLVDQFSRKFHPTVLDDLGLIPALQSYVLAFSKRTGINVQLHSFPGVERLSVEKKTALYHVVQEALAQVDRHKGASQIRIYFDKIDRGVRMKIADNGISSQRPTRSRTKRGKGLELLGMKERLEMVGGSFAVDSIKGVGTTISTYIPFAKRSEQPVRTSLNAPQPADEQSMVK